MQIDAFRKISITKINRPADCYEAAVKSGIRDAYYEKVISSDPYLSYLYAKNVINKDAGDNPHRWPEAELSIQSDPTASVRYAEEILRDRWNNAAAEKIIAESVIWAPIYCNTFNLPMDDFLSNSKSQEVLHEDLNKAIDSLFEDDVPIEESWKGPYQLPDFNLMSPIQVVRFLDSYQVSHEYKEEICNLAKPFVLKHAYASYLYAKDIMGAPWPEGEPIILTSPRATCEYCIHVKGSWPEGEKVILQDAECSVDYASELLEGRWEEAEDIIKTDPMQALNYAVNRMINHYWNDPALEREMIKLMPFSGNTRNKLYIYATEVAGYEDLESFIKNNDSMVSELVRDDFVDFSDLEQE